MFDIQKKELYTYITKTGLYGESSIVEMERKSIVKYTFDNYKWIVVPKGSSMCMDDYDSKYRIIDSTHLFFIDILDFGEIKNSSLCRELKNEDKELFEKFKDNCSTEDKDEGMVSLDDDFVYGLFINGNIVAVSSLWDWGDIISDVGVLVHPEYRRKGYAKSVCQSLMSNINKKFVWRCDEENEGSHKLAESIGFIHAGVIQELIEK